MKKKIPRDLSGITTQHPSKDKTFCTKVKSLFAWCSRNKKGLKFMLKGDLKKQYKEKGS